MQNRTWLETFASFVNMVYGMATHATCNIYMRYVKGMLKWFFRTSWANAMPDLSMEISFSTTHNKFKQLLYARFYSPFVSSLYQDCTIALACFLWWISHSESVWTLCWVLERSDNFFSKVADEKDVIFTEIRDTSEIKTVKHTSIPKSCLSETWIWVCLELELKPLTWVPQKNLDIYVLSLLTADSWDCRLNLDANMADNAVYRALRLYVLFFTDGSSDVCSLYLCATNFSQLP